MDIITTIAIIIVSIIITFLAFIFFPRNNNYFDYEKKCPELQLLLDNINTVRNECIKLDYRDWINNKDKMSANVLYIFDKISKDVLKIPNTYNLLTKIPNLKSVILFKINPDVYIDKQKDIIELSNTTIRCIIPLKLSTMIKNGIIVSDNIKIFQNDQVILFDNSKEYSIFNKHKYNHTYLLVLDITRPVNIPIGTSDIKNTNQYDDIMNKLDIFDL
jgi:hypothetical protein